MYGLIGKILASEGNREALISILLENADRMEGCLSYIVSRDPHDELAIWVTEAWLSKEDHEASLSLDTVKDAITRARPLIAGFEGIAELEPVGGRGV